MLTNLKRRLCDLDVEHIFVDCEVVARSNLLEVAEDGSEVKTLPGSCLNFIAAPTQSAIPVEGHASSIVSIAPSHQDGLDSAQALTVPTAGLSLIAESPLLPTLTTSRWLASYA